MNTFFIILSTKKRIVHDFFKNVFYKIIRAFYLFFFLGQYFNDIGSFFTIYH